MKFKVDENLPIEVAQLLQADGHDAITVSKQRIGGEADSVIARICQQEERIIITVDLDFADIRAYPPENFPGLIVLRLKRQDKFSVMETLRRLLPLLEREPVRQRLWIVEEDRIRIRE
jgi:predicted nuclease of predicted toxin-antitoxin system